MIGGEDEVVERLDPLLEVDRARRRGGRAHPGTDRRAVAGRAGLSALRPERRRALREDGPQRHRVRHHGRLRRGPEHPPPRQRRQGGPRRRRDRAAGAPASTTSTTSTPPRSPRCGGAAAWSRSWLLDLTAAGAARVPDARRASPGRVSDSGEGRWTSIAAIDEGVPGAGADRRALLALRLARAGQLRRPGAVGDAPAVRRPRRDGAGLRFPRPSASAASRQPASGGSSRCVNIEGDRGSGHPGQHDSRTIKPSSRQCAFIGLITLRGSGGLAPCACSPRRSAEPSVADRAAQSVVRSRRARLRSCERRLCIARCATQAAA